MSCREMMLSWLRNSFFINENYIGPLFIWELGAYHRSCWTVLKFFWLQPVDLLKCYGLMPQFRKFHFRWAYEANIGDQLKTRSIHRRITFAICLWHDDDFVTKVVIFSILGSRTRCFFQSILLLSSIFFQRFIILSITFHLGNDESFNFFTENLKKRYLRVVSITMWVSLLAT